MKKARILMWGFLLLAVPAACTSPSANSGTGEAEENSLGEAEPTYQVKSIDMSIKGEDILPAMLEPFKGSTVLVDFWATWCGPCRIAMRDIDALKPALMKEGVKFVYVTGENSPVEDWNDLLPNISGYHYRITADQWAQLCQTLGMHGIPAYMIIGKDGSVVWDNVTQGGYPGNKAMELQLKEAVSL